MLRNEAVVTLSEESGSEVCQGLVVSVSASGYLTKAGGGDDRDHWMCSGSMTWFGGEDDQGGGEGGDSRESGCYTVVNLEDLSRPKIKQNNKIM